MSGPTLTASVEDARQYRKLQSRLFDTYKPVNAQQEADIHCLSRLIWQTERTAHLIETDLNLRLEAPILSKIKDPSVRLLKATRHALARREHVLLVNQNEANLRSTNTLATRVDKWNSSR